MLQIFRKPSVQINLPVLFCVVCKYEVNSLRIALATGDSNMGDVVVSPCTLQTCRPAQRLRLPGFEIIETSAAKNWKLTCLASVGNLVHFCFDLGSTRKRNWWQQATYFETQSALTMLFSVQARKQQQIKYGRGARRILFRWGLYSSYRIKNLGAGASQKDQQNPKYVQKPV